MEGDRYYCLSALPTLGELGRAPPLSPDQLLEHLAPCPTARRVAEVLFLHDDLLQREGVGAGELSSVRPVVLTDEQVRGESPLPAYLSACLPERGRSQSGDAQAESSGDPARVLPADTTWEAYFRHAADMARTCACGFLADWVAFEVGLRNALVISRAKELGLDADAYLVAVELGEPDESFTEIVDKRAAAATPLAELETLIKVRWAWLTQHEAWFSFSDDEFAAYAGKLMLLIQFERLVKTNEPGASAGQDVDASKQPEEVAR